MDDITFCLSECKQTDCFRHPSNIQDRTIPHSYADFKGTETCPEKTQLSKEDATKDATFDCISRQAVINEMKDMYTAAEEWAQGAHDDDTRARAESCMATNVELKLRIEKLPSVQPEIIRCRDCKYRLNHYCHHEDTYDLYVHMDDYCSRGEKRT